MANRFSTPILQFGDTTGLPYAGGSLTFQASGTSTPLATFSDRALTIPNTNPVVLDSAGRAGNIFLQNLAYKVILADVNSNVIWTEDPVYASDFSTTASFLSGAGSPNGVVAGSQGSPTVPASVYWDTTNNILYVCTVTGNAATAVWTAVNASASTPSVPAPQGRLTPTSGTPVIASDASAVGQFFYTPYVGNLVPIFNGTSFIPTVFSEIGMTLVAAHAANTLYDVFVFSNAGVLTLVTGPAWATSTAGSGSRGTGAGTTQLTRLNGFWVNAVSMTARNGGSTFTVGANLATYLGSLSTDGSTGVFSCLVSYGQSRKWGLWNAYNRERITLLAGDPSASWVSAPTTWRESNGATTNFAAQFCGLPEETGIADFTQTATLTSPAGTTSTSQIAIGINSTTVITGQNGTCSLGWTGTGTITSIGTLKAGASLAPSIGINNFNMLEQAPAGTTNNQFNGTSANMRLVLQWMG